MKYTLLIISLFLFVSCKKSDGGGDTPEPAPPTAKDPTLNVQISYILDNAVTVDCNISDIGTDVKEYGFLYSKNTEFDLNTGTKVAYGASTTGPFVKRIEGLESGTTYNGKFYLIKNDTKVFYSAVKQFKTVSPGTWVNLTNCPARIEFGAGFIIDGLVYIVSGISVDGSPRKVFVYDLKTNQWTAKKDLPFSSRYQFNAFAANDKGYIALGRPGTGSEVFDEVWEYTPSTDSWLKKSNCPIKTYDDPGFAVNNKFYVKKSEVQSDNTIVKNVYEYTPATDSWVLKSQIPAAIDGFISGSFTNDGAGFFHICARDYYAFISYSPDDNTWTAIRAPVSGYTWPTGRAAAKSQAVLIQNKVFTTLGDQNPEMYRFDMQGGTWRKMDTPYPGTAVPNGMAFNLNNYMFYLNSTQAYLYIPNFN